MHIKNHSIVRVVATIIVAILVMASVGGQAHANSYTFSLERHNEGDGDSFRVVGYPSEAIGDRSQAIARELRLWGIDAPEWSQTCKNASGSEYACGAAASAYRQSLTRGRQMKCITQSPPVDRYGRLLARCYIDGVELGTAMVEAGHAVDAKMFSNGAFASAEAAARSAKKGLWQGAFVMPWDYRKRR